MVDITITANKAMDTSTALASLAQMLDNVQKNTESFSKALKTATETLGGAVTAVTDAVKGADKPQDQLLAQLKTLKGQALPSVQLEAALGSIYGLAVESGPAVEKIVARYDSLQSAGKITLEQYADSITRAIEGLQSGQDAIKRLSDSISAKAKTARETLEKFPEIAITGLVDTFVDAVVKGKDIGEAMSAKLKNLGATLLDNIVESLLRDTFDAFLGKKDANAFGSGVTGLFNNMSGIFSNILSNVFGNLFSGLFGIINSVFGGINSIFGSIFSIFNAQGNVFDPYGLKYFANGNAFDPYGLQRFARGGIVNQPTLFPFANGIGLMGEAGPEAIMPLGRDGRGNLGVRIADGAMRGGDTFISNFNVEVVVENSGGGDMTDEQARALGTQINAAVEMQVAKQMYDYARSGIFRSGAGRGY